MSANKLRLGPLPKSEPFKLTVTLSAELKATLDRYAALHARTYGEQTDAAALVPHMLEAFIARQRIQATRSQRKLVTHSQHRHERASLCLLRGYIGR